MSFGRLCSQIFANVSRIGYKRVIPVRGILKSSIHLQDQQPQEVESNKIDESEEPKVHPSSDRSKKIPVESSIQYLKSDAYKETYGDSPVWMKYKRNFRGQFAPRKTRKTCIRYEALATSNPCPICRDEFLVLDHNNVALLSQFISPYNGEIISYTKTGLCQRQHQNLLIAIHRAKDYGTIAFDLPFRKYDYSEWYGPDKDSQSKLDAEERFKETVEKLNKAKAKASEKSTTD